MDESVATLAPWLSTINVWFLSAVAVAGLIAFVRWSPPVRRILPRRDAGVSPGRFERFWSRRDGRVLSVAWVVLFALTVGDGGLVWSGQWQPVLEFFAILQPVAGLLLIPVTAGIFVYKGAIPQVARDESDEREREIQGTVYRRAHAIVLGSLAVATGLLAFNPAISDGVTGMAAARGVQLLDVVLPVFVLLFMLPSVAYAWMYPHREDLTPDDQAPSPQAVAVEAQ